MKDKNGKKLRVLDECKLRCERRDLFIPSSSWTYDDIITIIDIPKGFKHVVGQFTHNSITTTATFTSEELEFFKRPKKQNKHKEI